LAQLRTCSRSAGSTPGSFCVTSLYVSHASYAATYMYNWQQ
jgi:hypothetical protein